MYIAGKKGCAFKKFPFRSGVLLRPGSDSDYHVRDTLAALAGYDCSKSRIFQVQLSLGPIGNVFKILCEG